MDVTVIYDGPIINRRDAADAGLVKYFTGKPCPNGHVDQRYVASCGCLKCLSDYTARKLAENPRHWTELSQSYRSRNPDASKKTAEKWKSKRKEYDRDWRARNIEAVRKSGREHSRRVRSTIEGRLASVLRVYVRRCVKEKNFKSFDVLGYQPSDLRSHIERQFIKGMTWENYGEWHIDHINPVSWFTKQGVTCPKEINALSNLRPIWGYENMSKRDQRTHLL